MALRSRKPRFLVDVDEVLADFQTPVLEIISEVTGKKSTLADYSTWDLFSYLQPEEEERVYQRLDERGFCLSLKPLPGAQEAIEKLRALADVYVVTSPYHGPYWVSEREAWLKTHFGFSRSQIAHLSAKFLVGGDFFLDDKPEHINTWGEEHPDGVPMLWHLSNTVAYGNDHLRVYNWEQVLTKVQSAI